MSRRPIDRSADLQRLRAERFNIEVHAGYLLVHDVPYVNERREVRRGMLVTALDLSDDITLRPSDHTIKFVGEYPCRADGIPIEAIKHGNGPHPLTKRITANHSFSSKPPRGYYNDFYEKVVTYTAILSGPARSIDASAIPQTGGAIEPEDEDSPFLYIDSASARAEIALITEKTAVEKVSIVGLGGSGSYVLDFIAKMPVKEIHLFDGDLFSSHNAFRAPGAASPEDLRKFPQKVEYFTTIYSKMRTGVVPHDEYLDETNADLLQGSDCIFLCIDAGPRKKALVQKLEELGLLFIDTGMGLFTTNSTIGGILRVTVSEPEGRAAARAEMSFAGDDGLNEYDKNIQIAELNALNAALAVIRWKKYRGYYFDGQHEFSNFYSIGQSQLANKPSNDSD